MKNFLMICLCALLCLIPGVNLYAAQTQTDKKVPELNYVYVDEANDEDKQLVIVNLELKGQKLDSAVLYYKDGDEILSEESGEIVDGYAAFLLKKSSELNLLSVQAKVDGQSFQISLSDQEQLAEVEVIQNAEGIVTADEELTAGDIAAAVGNQSEKLHTSARKSNIVIVLDPGHGGSAPGVTRQYKGVTYKEKEMTLKISRYTKEELEKYSGVTVYMTRNSDVNPDLAERVDFAAAKGADALVSQHINSTAGSTTTASGALILISKGQYRPELAQGQKELGRAILQELEKIGFKNMDYQIRLSETSTKYPNGELADYYGIVKRSVDANIVGFIVEHGFMNNDSDVMNLLSTDEKLKAIGIADATGIAKYFGLSKGGWVLENGKWYYMNGSNKATGWLNLGYAYYYLDQTGAMVIGKQTINGKDYIFKESGEMQTGWISYNSARYYCDESGAVAKNTWIGMEYVGEDGKVVEGKKRIGWIDDVNGWWYRYEDGSYPKGGITQIGNEKYYFGEDGYMQTGLILLNGATYYFTESGAMAVSTTLIIDGKTYVFDKNGIASAALPTGWIYTGEKWWYRYADGSYPINTWMKDGSKWYYFDQAGYMVVGWLNLGNTKYYLTSNGSMAENETIVIDGKKCKFDQNGAYQEEGNNGKWILNATGWWYLNTDGSYPFNTWSYIDGKWYFFNQAGYMVTGWLKNNEVWYYLRENGTMAENTTLRIDGRDYHFSVSGACTNK